MKYSKLQPVDGETILHCGHLKNTLHHIFAFGPDLPASSFKRPDGTMGKSRWMVLCQSCFKEYAENPAACIRGDAIWHGNAPAIKEEEAN